MKRGEIWLVNLDPAIGAEIRKTRPAVIVSNDLMGRLPLKIVVPITAWKDAFARAEWHVRLEANEETGLDKPSSADTFQVRSISEQRLVRRIGTVGEAAMALIEQGLRISLEI